MSPSTGSSLRYMIENLLGRSSSQTPASVEEETLQVSDTTSKGSSKLSPPIHSSVDEKLNPADRNPKPAPPNLRKVRRSDDERRLTGYFKVPSDATPIVIGPPVAPNMQQKKPITSGFVPRNTINTPNQFQQSSLHRDPTAHQKKNRPLSTEHNHLSQTDWKDSLSTNEKDKASTYSGKGSHKQSVITVDIGEDDPLGVPSQNGGSDFKIPDRRLSSQALTPINRTLWKGEPSNELGKETEYRKVERMMHPRQKGKLLGSAKDQVVDQNSSTISQRGTKTRAISLDTITVSDDESQHNHSRKDTSHAPTVVTQSHESEVNHAPKDVLRKENKVASPYFSSGLSRNDKRRTGTCEMLDFEEPSAYHGSAKRGKLDARDSSPPLRKKFKRDEGLVTSDENIDASIDDLMMGDPISKLNTKKSNVRYASPKKEKPVIVNSPEGRKPTRSPDFHLPKVAKVSKGKRKKLPTWDLVRIKHDKYDIHSPSILMEYCDNNAAYIVHYLDVNSNGHEPKIQHLYKIDPSRIISLKHGGRKVFLKGSKTDHVLLDFALEFSDEPGLKEFLAHLGSISHVRDYEKDPEIMSKIFENPHNFVIANHSTSDNYQEDEAYKDELSLDDQRRQETRLLEKRAQRNNNTYNNSHHHEQAAEPPPRRKLISQLQVDPTPSENDISRSKKVQTSFSEPLSVGVSSSRATRSSNKQITSKILEQTADMDVPLEQKYSIKFGLGARWKHPVVFPPTGRKRTTVEFEDLERLDDGEFLNDNLVSFYMSWIASKVNLEDKRVYFFNTYFYTSLTNTQRGIRGINYAGVQRWTSKDNIFGYDYVVIPINEDAHWYVAIICNLTKLGIVEEHISISTVESTTSTSPPSKEKNGQHDSRENTVDATSTSQLIPLKRDNEEDWPDPQENPPQIDTSPFRPKPSSIELEPQEQSITGLISTSGSSIPGKKKGKKKSGPRSKINVDQPVIIILDSLGLSHSKTGRCLKDYLYEEFKNKLGREVDVNTIKCVYPKGDSIPLQSNYCDCGLFLLGYIDKFLVEPRQFMTKLLSSQMDSEEDWPDMDASKMRHRMRVTLQELASKQAAERVQKPRKSGPVKQRQAQIAQTGDSEVTETGHLKPALDKKQVNSTISDDLTSGGIKMEPPTRLRSSKPGKIQVSLGEDAEMLDQPQGNEDVEMLDVIPNSQPTPQSGKGVSIEGDSQGSDSFLSQLRQSANAWSDEQQQQQRLSSKKEAEGKTDDEENDEISSLGKAPSRPGSEASTPVQDMLSSETANA